MEESNEARAYDPYWRWSPRASCRNFDVGMFFPEGGSYHVRDGRSVLKPEAAEVKEVCSYCPVLTECGRASLGEEYGIWGGMTERERITARRVYAKEVAALPAAQRLRLGGRIQAVRSNDVSWKEISRQFALPQKVCQTLAEDWRKRPAEPTALPARGVDGHKALAWPKRPPRGHDSWIRHQRLFLAADYVAESPDGWLYMRYKHGHMPTFVWLKPKDVKFCRSVPPVFKDRIGRRTYATSAPLQRAG